MSSDGQSKVQARHLKRSAFLYVRQSSLRQVFENIARALNVSMICVSEPSHSAGASIKWSSLIRIRGNPVNPPQIVKASSVWSPR